MTEAFTLDLNRCTGCEACRLACSIENELGLERSWRQIVTFNAPRHPGLPTYHLSLACNHCADAPCERACPALAIGKDPGSGIVKIDPGKCIGCRYCTWACPYEALRYDDAASVMTKCTFCDHRLAEGLEPACVTACPTGALGRGNLDELTGVDRVPGFPAPAPRPSIRFTPLRGKGGSPESSLAGGAAAAAPGGGPPAGIPGGGPAPGAEARPASEITLAGEWPLLAFTLLASVLVGRVAAALLGGSPPDPRMFLAAGGAAMLVSVQHLGRKTRAWRAIRNVRRSWLSREIAGFGAFLGLSALALLLGTPPILGGMGALVGFLALFAMDRVYDPVRRPAAKPVHSADVLLTGLLMTGILAREPWLAGPAALLKAGLYVRRHAGGTWRDRVPLDLLRLGVGLLLPAAVWLAWPRSGLLAVFVLALIGETADRCAFYLELEVPTPRRQAERDLAGLLGAPDPGRS